jgi:hypothetical protein
MQIDRHNYEEYFILYMDNELSAAERRVVEAFAAKHPDLQEELDSLLQYKLEPDTRITYHSKDELLKINGDTPITLSNYEEWLLLYADNELSPAQKKSVEDFIAANPVVHQEWNLLQKSRLFADETVVFANKEILYRHTEKVRPLFPRWWRIGAAAVLLISAGITTAVLINSGKDDSIAPPVATTTAPKTTNTEPQPGNSVKPGTDPNAGTVTSNNASTPAVAPGNNSRQQELNSNIAPATAIRNNKPAARKNELPLPVNNQSLTILPEQVRKNETAIAENKTVAPTNNLPMPDQNPNLNNYRKKDEAIAKNDIPAEIKNQPNTPLTNSIVTTGNPQPSDIVQASLPENGKKNKLRGFFRKVTRTFEKRTNIEATDGEDRLLIAGLSFKMK